MKCKLCLLDKIKLVKSHIIPEFEYKRNGLLEGRSGAKFDLKTGRIVSSLIGEY